MPDDSAFYGSITRTQAARRLGCSWATVLKYESSGRLNAFEHDGTTRIPLQEVESLRSELRANRGIRPKKGRPKKAAPSPLSIEQVERRGKMAGAVFDCFAAGKSLQDIVREARIDPGTVRELWEEWQKPLTQGSAERVEENRLKQEEAAIRESRRKEAQEERSRFTDKRLEIKRLELETERLRLARGMPVSETPTPSNVRPLPFARKT